MIEPEKRPKGKWRQVVFWFFWVAAAVCVGVAMASGKIKADDGPEEVAAVFTYHIIKWLIISLFVGSLVYNRIRSHL
jgi:fucose permease